MLTKGDEGGRGGTNLLRFPQNPQYMFRFTDLLGFWISLIMGLGNTTNHFHPLKSQRDLLADLSLPLARHQVIPYLDCMSRVIRRWWETVFKFSGFLARFPIINILFARGIVKAWLVSDISAVNCHRMLWKLPSPSTHFNTLHISLNMPFIWYSSRL